MNKVQSLNNNDTSSEIINILEKCYRKSNSYRENPFQLFVNLDSAKRKPVQYFIKRFIEINGIIPVLIIIFPVFLLIALAIKLSSRGPVIFKQKRIGQNGREFYMYKFRSMYVGSEEKLDNLEKYNQTNELMFKLFDDPRITGVGKFLRKHSLDELPQLFNVLKGEMSLVGFRPPLPSEVAKYKKWHYVRFAIMPGLTGPWQVNGRSNIKNFDEVINLEYEYIKNWSLIEDFRLLVKTLPVVLSGKGAA